MSDAERKRRARADERDLKISRVKDVKRRKKALADPYVFLPTYFANIFYQPFTADRREMIDAIMHASRFGGDQAVAGPRADGKTRSALFCALLLALGGFIDFPIIISKSGPRAKRELKNLKDALKGSESFAEDFPEVAEPIIDLGGWASRANQQTAFGENTNMEWGTDCIVLPTISTKHLVANGWNKSLESAARGQIVASLGIEGPIRGYSVRNRRPDLALLDDVDDRKSANSELQTETRENIVEQDVGGLAGPDKTIARVMLCTLINRTCLAATFTDRTKKGSWRGQRHRLLDKKPDREDMWEEHTTLRRNRSADDPDARVAHQMYLDNRQVMDAGAVVTNPYRFDSRLLDDGKPAEVSALEYCYNLIADRGWEHFATEYQNDPPEKAGPVESGITPGLIQRQLSGLPCRQMPEGAIVLTHTVDVGKWKFHWVVRAWKPDGGGHTIDYGILNVHGAKYRSDEGLDRAIRAAILRRCDEFYATNYTGGAKAETITLVDAGYRTDAVYAACAEAGIGVYPVMGFGKSAGCCGPNFSPAQKKTKDTRPGDGWKMVKKGRIWLVECDADRWKAYEADRWMTATDRPGCMFLWGTPSNAGERERMSADELGHREYALQSAAEVEIEEMVKGSLKRKWKAKGENHYGDANYYSCVAANIKGIRLPMASVAKVTARIPETASIGAVTGLPRPAPKARPTAQQLLDMSRNKSRTP